MKLILLFSLLLFLGPRAVAAEAAARPAQQENRYLFVLDSSFGMARAAKGAQQAVAGLIHSGMEGQMRAGDTYGIWTFNQELSTEFPMQQWSPQQKVDLAGRAHGFLGRVRYQKQAQFGKVMPALNEVIEASRSLTIILISDGKTPVAGTPFDEEINDMYRRHIREVSDARLAFVTFLAARDGKLVDHSVNSSLGPMRVPPLPPPPEPEVKPQVTQAPPAPDAVKRNPPPAANTAARPSPAVRTNSSPARPPAVAGQPPRPSASLSQPAANRPVPTPPPEARTEAPLPPVLPPNAVPSPSVVSTAAPAPALPAPGTEIKSEPAPLPSRPIPVEKTVEHQPLPELHTTRQPATSSDATPASVPPSIHIQSNLVPADKPDATSGEVLAVQGDGGKTSRRLFAALAAFLVFAAGFAFLWLRKIRNDSQPSLISRSMHR